MIALFFYSDCFLAFKVALMFCIGQYLVMCFKFFYREPHPFYTTDTIQLKNNSCAKLDYACPSYTLFNLQFMWVYINYNYRYKYNLSSNKVISYVLSLFYFLNMIMAQLFLIYFGWVYIYQSMLTYAIVFTYLRLIIYFDDDIMQFTEQLGFIKKTSRVMKFHILFAAVSGFILA